MTWPMILFNWRFTWLASEHPHFFKEIKSVLLLWHKNVISKKWETSIPKKYFKFHSLDNRCLSCSIWTPNWLLIIFWKIGNTLLTSYLSFKRKSQVALEQSSIKNTNYCALEIFWIQEGLQTLVRINVKEVEDFLFLKGKDTRYLANLHVSQWKLLTSKYVNNEGNIFFNKEKSGCHKWKWRS